ncbi:MAG TPA: aminotransferase class I/II-fold pyridoxal phosphate-dependent enzyme [Bacteroidales bacterium]|nr:aminotransferase class I/II-fold pyridoxal phosphate-dependent enzyme [Bacteroidales bacterium]
MMRVPYGMTVHGQEEIDAVVEVLKTSTQMGRNVMTFEERVAKLFDKKYGLMLNSGSSALFLGAEVLNLPKGSEVITPVLTFSTTIASLVKNGLVPAFVDVESDTFLIDINKIEEMISDKTKAIAVPNLLGNIPDWDIIYEIARKYNLKIIEDSADTLGGILHGRSTGFNSDISITSFYGSHIINCAGNGGMLCLNDDGMYRRAKLLRSWGRSSSIFPESEKIENRFNTELEGIRYDAKFVFEEIGYNLEPSEIGAAFGLIQLNKLQENINARIENFNRQFKFFKQFKDWFILPKQTAGTKTGWLAFPLIVKDTAPFTRTEMQIALEKANIQTRVVFTGNILKQPGFKNIHCIKNKNGYPNADNVMRGGILIACHHGLTDEMINYIHDSFRSFVKKI